MRLIDADALDLSMQKAWVRREISNPELRIFRDMLIDEPTIDPVRHGRWYEIINENGDEWMCSECLEVWVFVDGYQVYNCHYCPKCGARMDGGKDETD